MVVSIDTDIITFRELKTSYLLHICSNYEKNDHSVRKCLEELVDYYLIPKEIPEKTELTEEDYIEEEERIIREVGGLERVLDVLKEIDMSWEEFREILSKKIISKKLIENIFYTKVSVSLSEIEDYYSKKYLPSMNNLGVPPRSIIEMTPYIEKEIAKEKVKELLEDWLSEKRKFYEIVFYLSEEDITAIIGIN